MTEDDIRRMQAMGYAMAYADATVYGVGQVGAAVSNCVEFAEYAMRPEIRNRSLQTAYQLWLSTLDKLPWE